MACEYWKLHNLNALADQDDIVAITRRINGGLNGLDERRGFLARAKAVLARLTAGLVATTFNDTRPILWRGSQNETVAEAQKILRALGFPFAIDGDFGAATELAIMHIQAAHGLTPDGVVGPLTWHALSAAAQPSNRPIVANAAA